MTIPRLLTASAPPNFSSSAGQRSGIGGADSSSGAGDPSGAESTDELSPTDSGDLQTVPTDGGSMPTQSLPADLPPTDGSVPGGGAPTVAPGTGVDLAAVAATFGCTDYAQQLAMPGSTSYGECVLAGGPVQLYAFATDEDQGVFIEQLVGEGMTVDQLVQGERFIVIPGPAQLANVRAALTAG
ncbi:MAG: hypothetical protein ABJD68_15955 [Nakamurella sp.]